MSHWILNFFSKAVKLPKTTVMFWAPSCCLFSPFEGSSLVYHYVATKTYFSVNYKRCFFISSKLSPVTCFEESYKTVCQVEFVGLIELHRMWQLQSCLSLIVLTCGLRWKWEINNFYGGGWRGDPPAPSPGHNYAPPSCITQRKHTRFSTSSPGFDSRHSKEFLSWCWWDLLTALPRTVDTSLIIII